MQITRRLEFDAGHRIPNHKGQCRHLHGHRYVLEITLSGDIIRGAQNADDGMLMDFSEIKRIANEYLIGLWDHAFFVYREDHVVAEFLATLPDHRTVTLDVTPTVENLARVAFDTLDPLYRDIYGNHLRLEKIRLYETPNCWADITRP
jgi:6-pyruvoyltetrahydropterin/6-carboxytetrahydropterin synthase